MKINRYYRLFTKKDIQHDSTRIATNCYNATLYKCTRELNEKCRKHFPELWKYCPKQTKAQYKYKESSSDRLEQRENR